MTFAKLHCLDGQEQLDRAAVIVWLRMNEVERFGEFLRWCQERAPAISPFGDAFQWRLSIAPEPQWQFLWIGFIANPAVARKRAVKGKRVSVGVGTGGSRVI